MPQIWYEFAEDHTGDIPVVFAAVEVRAVQEAALRKTCCTTGP